MGTPTVPCQFYYSLSLYINNFYAFYTGQCTTKSYVKADGSCACGFYLERGLTYKQASDKCKSLGASIPEIKNAQENADIFSIKVISHYIQILFIVHKKAKSCYLHIVCWHALPKHLLTPTPNLKLWSTFSKCYSQ
jgi:hypothetical protein